jgi:drug/metabolite transporter (DMT)-like permease
MLDNTFGIIVACILAVFDVITFDISKAIYLNKNCNKLWLILPAFIYGCQIFLFYYGLHFTTMTELNIVWNIISSIIVAISGIFFFNEQLTHKKMIAVILGLLSIILFSLE